MGLLKVVLNGKALDLPEGLTIKELVRLRGLVPDSVIIEHNGELVKKDAWDSIILKENDSLEILRFVGGG